MAWTEAQVPLLDPATDKFPDRFAPPSVAADKLSAAASAAAALASEQTATTQAGIATTQAGIATTQAGIAATQAGIATTQAETAATQAGIATTQAETATTQAALAQTAASNASISAGAANTSADTAATQAGVATTQAGTATTKAGEASTSADTATTKAGEASTSAGTATTKAGEAAASAAAALTSEQNAAATLAGAITKAGTAGFPARDGSGATNSRTITAGTGVTVTNGDGGSGNPTVAVTAGTYAPQAGLYLSGVATDYVSAPDADTLDITGDIEVIWRGVMINWTDATAVKPLISKWDTAGNQRGWHFWLASGATPTPTLTWSPNGTDLLAASCTAAITGVVTNGVPLWLRVTLDVDNGAGGRTAQFHRSADGVTWTKIGSDVTVAAVTNIYACTAPLRVGLTATSAIAAIHQRAIVKNGIGGTTVADWDGRIPHTRQRDAAGNIWTINGTANAWQVI